MDGAGAKTTNGNSPIEVERQSLRGFLRLVEKDFPDQLIRIKEPVSTRLDITSTIFELERAGKSPVVIFENVTGHDMPVVTNIAGNRDLLAATLGVDSSALPSTYRERCQNYPLSNWSIRRHGKTSSWKVTMLIWQNFPSRFISRSIKHPISPPDKLPLAIPNLALIPRDSTV